MQAQTYVISVGVVINNDGKVLLLKRPGDAQQSPGEWEFISGSFDVLESAEDLILRECKEEAGIKGEITTVGGSFEYKEDSTRWIIVPYLLVSDTDVVHLSDEHIESIWVELQDIKQYDKENGDNYLETILDNFKRL